MLLEEDMFNSIIRQKPGQSQSTTSSSYYNDRDINFNGHDELFT